MKKPAQKRNIFNKLFDAFCQLSEPAQTALINGLLLLLNASKESLRNMQYLCGSVSDYRQRFSIGFRKFNLEAFRFGIFVFRIAKH